MSVCLSVCLFRVSVRKFSNIFTSQLEELSLTRSICVTCTDVYLMKPCTLDILLPFTEPVIWTTDKRRIFESLWLNIPL
jgi:hypothetical protein